MKNLKAKIKSTVMILHLEGLLKGLYWLRRQQRRPNLVDFGSLRKLQPISRNWGYDRGQPISRYYIENFLKKYSEDIRGHVLEFKDSNYTRKFGGNRVIKSDVCNVEKDIPESTIVADMTHADHIPSDIFDCIIATETLQYIYDKCAAARHLYRILKPGGVLLASLPGVGKINKQWGDCWRFTSISVSKLFEEFFPSENIFIEAHGNVLASIAYLHGLAAKELKKEELEYKDPEYETFITVRAVKPLKK